MWQSSFRVVRLSVLPHTSLVVQTHHHARKLVQIAVFHFPIHCCRPFSLFPMSSGWAPFLDDRLLSLGLSTAAIVAKSGEPLALSPNLSIPPLITKKLVAALERAGAAQAELLHSGFLFDGARYAVSRIDSDDTFDAPVLLGRCKDTGAPTRGVIVCLTTQAVIFVVHDPLEAPELSFGKTNVAVSALADVLISLNY